MESFHDELVGPGVTDLPERFFDRFVFNLHRTDATTPSIIFGLGIQPARDTIDGFDNRARILSIAITRDDWPPQRAVAGFDLPHDTPFAGLWNVGDAVRNTSTAAPPHARRRLRWWPTKSLRHTPSAPGR